MKTDCDKFATIARSTCDKSLLHCSIETKYVMHIMDELDSINNAKIFTNLSIYLDWVHVCPMLSLFNDRQQYVFRAA